MTIYDISITTTPKTVTWDDEDTGFSFNWNVRIGPDTVANVSEINIGSHTGTHLDAPLHFIENAKTVETLDVNVLVGPAMVVEINDCAHITAAHLEAQNLPSDLMRIVFKTDNTKRGLVKDTKFHTDYVGLAPSAAQWLVTHGIRLIGVDYLSVGPYGEENIETHRILLGAGVVIVETLLLDHVQPGNYTLMALPPKFEGLEGCPCRALLIGD